MISKVRCDDDDDDSGGDDVVLLTEGVRSCCRDLLERRVVGRACVVFPEIASERSEVVDGFSKIYIDETSKL